MQQGDRVHIPEGFINLPTSVGAAAVAGGSVWASMKAASTELKDRLVPFAGLTAAFVFALQMLNFPVAAGTTGHLLGGALAAVLLGPWLGIVAVTVVVVIQALLFADGGLVAMGLNVFNMAVITAISGWYVFRGVVKILPRRIGVLVASLAAGWVSVVVSSIGFSIQYAIGGVGGVDPGLVFSSMVGVHALIGIGEGLITAAAVGAVLAARPDLVTGARGITEVETVSTSLSKRAVGGFVGVGLAAAVALVMFVAPIAAAGPDGLERVAQETGFAATAQDNAYAGPFADYGVAGLENQTLGTVVSGLVGIGLTFAAGMIFVGLARRRSHRTEPA
ncbi:MAG: energy-coupling factor ABC transporter permease [Acidimicrobiia bacterium]